MPSLRRVPPGRAGALWLRHRLAVADRGSDLLRQKLVILVRERQRLRTLAEATRREWRAADREARQWLLRAAALGGERAVRQAVPAAPAEVTPGWTAVIGVRCPAQPRVQLPAVGADQAPAGSAVAAARDAYRRAALAAARHAGVATAQAAIEEATAATRQRVQALDRRWIPRLRGALAGVRQQMAELEDADAVRRLRASRPRPEASNVEGER